jgi:hypothetical protein
MIDPLRYWPQWLLDKVNYPAKVEQSVSAKTTKAELLPSGCMVYRPVWNNSRADHASAPLQ